MNQAANSLYPYVDQLLQNDVDADIIAEYLNHHQHLNCLQLVFLHIGHYYRERMRWDEAVQYLEKSKQGNLCCASCLTSSEAAIDDCRGATYVSVIVDICFTKIFGEFVAEGLDLDGRCDVNADIEDRSTTSTMFDSSSNLPEFSQVPVREGNREEINGTHNVMITGGLHGTVFNSHGGVAADAASALALTSSRFVRVSDEAAGMKLKSSYFFRVLNMEKN